MSVMCTGGIECSLQTKVQFMSLTLCWVWFKTFYIISAFCAEGGKYPRLARSHSLTLSLHDYKINKRASQDRRHGRPDRSRKKAGKDTLETFLKREWQVGKVSHFEKEGQCLQFSCLAFQMNRLAMETQWTQTCTMLEHVPFTLSDQLGVIFWQACERPSHKWKFCSSLPARCLHCVTEFDEFDSRTESEEAEDALDDHAVTLCR